MSIYPFKEIKIYQESSIGELYFTVTRTRIVGVPTCPLTMLPDGAVSLARHVIERYVGESDPGFTRISINIQIPTEDFVVLCEIVDVESPGKPR